MEEGPEASVFISEGTACWVKSCELSKNWGGLL